MRSSRNASAAATRGSRLGKLAVTISLLALAGACRQDMHNQPKYRSLRPSTLFADGSSARPLVEGTVARGTLNADEALFTGKLNGVAVKEMPFQITGADLDRGQERFNIYCTPCHDQSGNGRGMVVQRGYRQPPSFHTERLKQADAGYIFDVITNGFGAMPDYKAQIDVRDRWRIIAYLRALQLTQPTVPEPPPGAPGASTPAPAQQPRGTQPRAGEKPPGRGGH